MRLTRYLELTLDYMQVALGWLELAHTLIEIDAENRKPPVTAILQQ